MKCKMILGAESQFNLCTKTYQQTKLLSTHLGSCNSSLSFGTKLSMPWPSLSAKTNTAFRTITRASTVEAYTTETLYDLLGITESVTFQEIKKAYKQLARKYHPDVSPVDQVEKHTRMFIMVKEAYDTLSDPHTKSMYDRDLAGKSPNNKCERKNKLEFQLNELKRRTMNKNIRGKASSGARMRKQQGH